MTLVDTSVWIDYFRGIDDDRTGLLDNLLKDEVILLGDLVYYELLQGIRDDSEYRLVKNLLLDLRRVRLAGFGVAEKAARNFRILRNKGITVRKTIDMLIGAWCIEHRCRLLHNDHDFHPLVEHLGLKEAGP